MAKKEGAPASTAASGGAKDKRKKWSKSKTREKVQNLVVFDKATYDKFAKEVPTGKVITPATVSDRLKINGSLARRGLRELAAKGLIRPVAIHNRQILYTRMNAPATAPASDKPEKTEKPEKPEKSEKTAKK